MQMRTIWYSDAYNKGGREMKKILRFVAAMILAFLPGFIGVIFAPSGASDAWYNALNKSVLTPDGWVFGVAWTVLYAMTGIALFLVMNTSRGTSGKGRAYVLFGAQMVLNALWTYLFFGAHMMGLAFAVVVALIVISIWLMRSFYSINRSAAYLLIPYVAWLIFATYLNGTILYLN